MKQIVAAGLAAAGLLMAAGQSAAQGGGLAGEWRAMTLIGAVPVAFDLVVMPDNSFSETERSASIMTLQRGVMKKAGPEEYAFVVEDWEPKTMPVYHATGTSGGYYTQAPTTRPPGGIWRIHFNGPNSITATDVRLGGSLTYQRVR
jgi:hypothetical protein